MSKKRKIVIVKDDYTTDYENVLQLTKDEKYTIIDDQNVDWWMAVSKDGAQGYVCTQMVEEVKSAIDKNSNDAEEDSESDYISVAYAGRTGVRTSVDDNLEQQEWYYPKITREECEDILNKEAVVGCFIVRPSSQTGCYSLSIYYEKRGEGIVEHYLIRRNKLGHYFMFDEPPRATLSEMIRFRKQSSGELATRLTCSPDQKKDQQRDDFADHQISFDELVMLDTVGRGQFGMVKKAMWRGEREVAVKIMLSGTMSHDEFIQEAKTMLRLQHVRLVQLYGVVSSKDELQLVTEYMTNGSLDKYLRKTGEEILESEYRPVKICHQPVMAVHGDAIYGSIDTDRVFICLAMDYLESESFIHRDLAARNCLVGPNEVVKVGDFGLARYILEGVYIGSFGTQFAPQWAPPEVLKQKIFTSKSDVWSFGVVMWEVYTLGKMRPYGAVASLEVIDNIVCVKKTRLHKPKLCSDMVYDIMLQCWAYEAVKRPTFSSLLQGFAKLSEAESGYADLPNKVEPNRRARVSNYENVQLNG